jgi:hypothetical protein
MRRAIAEALNSLGSLRIDAGKVAFGKRLYKWAAVADSRWSVPWYNLGLQAKNVGRWQESFEFNQRALRLDPSDEAARWNLGIASTALRNWTEARKAWTDNGIELSKLDGEVLMPPVRACVRLNPQSDGEVVWGERLDPARMAILSVPLPESGHRFHDIVLNDGASDGTRVDENGNEVPVFNELSIWEVSDYSTYRVRLHVPDEPAEKHVVDLCLEQKLGIEDWTTIRFICAVCSRGNPGAHECGAKPRDDGSRAFGFAAKNQEDLESVLGQWASAFPTADYGELELMLPARLT